MTKNIISIYPGHNANVTFYNEKFNSYHIIEIEKLYGVKHARMETKGYVPFRDEYVNPIEAIPRCLEIAKKEWNIDNDFDIVINGTTCPDRNKFDSQLMPEVIDYTLNTKSVINGCPHHVAHMYSAWKQSPFERCYVMTLDGGGDDGVFNGYELHADGSYHKSWHDHSNMGRNINLLGSMITDISKNTHNRLDIAGKVMGLSAYGNYNEDYKSFIKTLITDNILNNEILTYRRRLSDNMPEEDAIKLLKDKASMSKMNAVMPFVDKDLLYDVEYIERTRLLVDKTRNSGHWWNAGKTDSLPPVQVAHIEGQDGKDYALAIQKACEDIVIEKIEKFYDIIHYYYQSNLLLSGGVALNVLINEKIRNTYPDLNVYVPPNPNDTGLSLGTIVEHRSRVEGDISKVALTYSGPRIQDPINEHFQKHDVVTPEIISKLLKQGKIIGLIQGNSEVGPRALGNRSILCDPSIPGMKDKLNAEVKFREWYRPFAPVCKLDDVNKYFKSNSYKYLQYMSFALEVREEYKEQLAAVTHVDNTARVQTDTKGDNKILYKILDHHGGVLVNTSFNIQGKPILNTLEEAFQILRTTGLDYFVYCDGKLGLQIYGDY